MAKSDKQTVFNTSMDKVNQSEKEYNALNDKIGGRGDVTWDRATEDYNPAFQGYSNYAAGGGLTDEDKKRMQDAVNAYGSAGGGGGGYSWNNINNPMAGKSSAYAGLSSAYGNMKEPDYTEADTGFRKLTGATGGFDQDQLNKIYGNTDTLSNIGKTGGVTDEDKANINRASILQQEQTGGYTDQDKALIRAKTAASSPAYFSTLKDNLDKTRSVMGGNLAGSGAVDFKLARQGAQQQAADRTNAEIGLAESVRKGKESVGQFLSNQDLALQNQRTQNQISGAQQAGALGLNTQEGITANQAEGLKGLAGTQTGRGTFELGKAGGMDQFGLGKAGGLDTFTGNQAQMDYQTQLANAQGNMQAGAGNAAAGAANARAGAQANMEYQQWLTEYGNQQKQYGISGLDELYNTNLGASQNYTGMGLSGLNDKYGTQGNLLGLAAQNRGATAGENASKAAKVAAAAAATYATYGAAGGQLYNTIKNPAAQVSIPQQTYTPQGWNYGNQY